MISISRLHYEFNAPDRSGGILVNQGHITRPEPDEFPLPSRVSNLHSQNTFGNTQRTSPVGHCAATRDGPSQQRAFLCWRVMKSSGDDGFESSGSAIQSMSPDSRTRSERRAVGTKIVA